MPFEHHFVTIWFRETFVTS